MTMHYLDATLLAHHSTPTWTPPHLCYLLPGYDPEKPFMNPFSIPFKSHFERSRLLIPPPIDTIPSDNIILHGLLIFDRCA
jgi:hypothetical protein